MPTYDRKFDSFSRLEKLHVYGDLLKLYTLPVQAMQATIAEVGNLHREIRTLETKMLTLYASYVLAHTGFYVELWTSKDFVKEHGKALYTTKYNDVDWIKDLDFFEPLEEESFWSNWEMRYKNERQERLKIIFVTSWMMETNTLTGITLDEVEVLLKKFDRSCSNYVVVHPELARKNVKRFKQAKEKMKQKAGQDLILSTGEFVTKLIPDKKQRYIVEENWESLREKIVGNLHKESPYPCLCHA